MHVTRTRFPFVDHALEIAAELRPQILQRLDSSCGPSCLRSLAEAVATATGTLLSDDEFALLYAEAVACGTAVTRLAGPLFQDGRVRAWVLEHANPLWKGIIEESFAVASGQDASDWEAEAGVGPAGTPVPVGGAGIAGAGAPDGIQPGDGVGGASGVVVP